MGLAENPFGWLWVNGAEEIQGSMAAALFPRHLLCHRERRAGRVTSTMLGDHLLRGFPLSSSLAC